MGIFDRLRRKNKPGTLRTATKQDTSYLQEWAQSRTGVEAFLEPRTNVTDTTVVLIAHDGEWTRRRIKDAEAAFDLGKRLSMPVYEVARVGYPQRMRDYQNRRRGR